MALEPTLLTLYKRLVRPVLYPLTPPAALLPFGEPLLAALGHRPRAPRRPDLAAVRRVLVLRLDLIGDFVFTTPLLRELRRALPAASITLVVSPLVAPLARPCPHVDEVLVLDPRGLLGWARTLAFARRQLLPRRFDLALLPRFVADEARGTLAAYASGARWRVGFAESPRHGKRTYRGIDRLLTRALPVRGRAHELVRGLELLRSLGIAAADERQELWTAPDDETRAAAILESAGVHAGERFVALVPATSARKKDWPLDRWAEVGRWLAAERRVRLVILGGPREREVGQRLAAAIGPAAADLTGDRAPLRESVALLRRAALYLGGNTGPVHMAAAVGIPVVEVSCQPRPGSDDADCAPARTGPLGTTVVSLQPTRAVDPCRETCVAREPHCILGVSVDEVKAAVARALPA